MVSLSSDEILSTIEEYAQLCAKENYDCCFLVILSHGQLGVILGADLKYVHLEQIYIKFDLKKLKRKPKYLIIEACRSMSFELNQINIID